jgi:AcrR family transcriptional regulator
MSDRSSNGLPLDDLPTRGAGRAPSPRRTQEERRSTTRAALLQAALDQLVESGLGAFTTTEVCRRAELSQGALFKHFATKSDLLAAVTEQLFAQLRDAFEAEFRALPAPARTVRGGLQLLWTQMLDPRLAAAFELYTAARTDHELRARLEPVVRAHIGRIETLAATLVDLGDPERVKSAVGLAIAAMQGLVLNQMALPDARQIEQLRCYLDGLGLMLLGAAADSPGRTSDV